MSLQIWAQLLQGEEMRQCFVSFKQTSNSPFWQNSSGPATVVVKVIYNVPHQADSQWRENSMQEKFLVFILPSLIPDEPCCKNNS